MKMSRLTETRIGTTHLTRATWRARKLWFHGKCSTSRDAERQLAVYRTVHFVLPSGAATTNPTSPR